MAQAPSDAEAVVRAHAALWNEQDYGSIPDVLAEPYVEYNPVAPGGDIRGRDRFEAWIREITTAFPDFQADVIEVLASDRTAILVITVTVHGASYRPYRGC